MATKAISKKYSVEQKQKYHAGRIQSSSATEDEKSYSRHWLDGFTDKHAETNLGAAKYEYKNKKDYIAKCEKEITKQKTALKEEKSSAKIIFGGYINGMTAKLNKEKGCKK